ncbi:MAG: hypothetical protein AAGB22_03135 [Bacteroidota bacterium]
MRYCSIFCMSLLLAGLIGCQSMQVAQPQQGQAQPVTASAGSPLQENGEEMSLSFLQVREGMAQGTGDPFTLEEANVIGDIMTVKVSYSGGCEKHAFTLYTNMEVTGSRPAELGLFLHHDNGNDRCEAWVTRSYQFDISQLRTIEHQTIRLRINSFPNELMYTHD